MSNALSVAALVSPALTAADVVPVIPVIAALTHAVLGLLAILSLAKFEKQLTWPKMTLWILFIAMIPLIGGIVWFAFGRRSFVGGTQ
ncbi:PLDc N-terminal domain-containing protein [Leucobacter sp. USHLN153]|uniref:PLDc N-terminal domain-containing protein n=1 Tax=Leucobacter sp. USHLN153 TaxID=3081268 RepID=UPI003017C1BB